MEENKEADSTTGQATHRISRGIHDKVCISEKRMLLQFGLCSLFNIDVKLDYALCTCRVIQF